MISIPDLKSRASLTEIIQDHIRLTKRGATLWGRCPFHEERTASFAVHPAYFHCHGCGVSGDVIDFTAKIAGVSKGRAIRLLAERYNIPAGPHQSHVETVYMRSLREQAEYWWVRRRAAALKRLECACERFFSDQTPRNEALADAAGKYLRMIDDVGPSVRGRVYLGLRLAADHEDWMESRAEVVMLGRIFGVRG